MIPILSLLACATISSGEVKDPRLEYRLKFDPADTTAVQVSVEIKAAPVSLQIAAHAHPEYDDKYWKYVESVTAVDGCGEMIPVSRIDSVRWQVHNAKPANIVVAYRMKFPREERPRSSWKPFLAATGGLIGGPHSFLYPIGLEKQAATVTLDIPRTWTVGTGLERREGLSFIAPDVFTLMESPMLVGDLSEWKVDDRHRIYYWRLPSATPFDTVALVSGVKKLVQQTTALFAGVPYNRYAFLFMDDSWSGGLEHPNSVTMGAQSEALAKDPLENLREIAHEFFHTWNLMSIKPSRYREVDYRVQPPVSELWFSEGLTIFYSDLLRRRAGIPVEDSTRTGYLRGIIQRYLSQTGNAKYSAEEISRVSYNASPAALGDYAASAHLIGEIIGTVLDLKIRDATEGSRSSDDMMRLMYERFGGKKFTSSDVRAVLDDVCRCSTDEIFDRHVFKGNPVDFNKWLEPLGMRMEVTWRPALQENGTPIKDLRTWAWQEGDKLLLRVSNPLSVWGKSDLHTGDEILTINAARISTWPEYRNVLSRSSIGDTLTFVVRRGGETLSRRVVVSGMDEPAVRIVEVAGMSSRQERLRDQWSRGTLTVSVLAPARPAARH